MKSKDLAHSKKISLYIALLGGLWAFIIHQVNINYLEEIGSSKTEKGMILTADDFSYTRHAENFSKTGTWKDNTQGVSSYIGRPPGMDIIHLVFYNITHHYQILHKIFHLILHVLALYFFGLICGMLLFRKWALICNLIMAMMPCFWGYLFYYISESVTPSLMIFLLYGYVRQWKQPHIKWLLFQSFCIGFLLLIRPQLIIFLLPYFYFLWLFIMKGQSKKWLLIFVCCVLAFGGPTIWQIRSFKITNSWSGIHPIYSVTNNTEFRPIHQSFGELFKIWEHNSEKFHGTMTALWSDVSYDTVINTNRTEPWPDHKILNSNAALLRDFFYEYALIGLEIKSYAEQNKPVPGETARETKLRLRVDSLTHVLRKKMWKENYVLTPLHSMQFMFTKSQLNLHIFQEKYRGKWWMEMLRWLCVILIVIITIISLGQLLNTKNKVFWLLAFSNFIYLFYLFFIQKMNEERYLLPLLPILLFTAIEYLSRILKKIIS